MNKITITFQKRYNIQIAPIAYSSFGPTKDELCLLGKDIIDKKIIDLGADGCQKAIYFFFFFLVLQLYLVEAFVFQVIFAIDL